MNLNCKEAKNFLKEWARMCSSAKPSCFKCLIHMTAACKHLSCGEFITQFPDIAIDLVQKWSDKNPQKILLDDLKEKYPNYQTTSNGFPAVCPYQLGYEEDMYCKEIAITCKECWNRLLEEVKK